MFTSNSDEELTAISDRIGVPPPVQPTPHSETHRSRSDFMRKSSASRHRHLSEAGASSRERVAYAIAGHTWPARLSVAKLADLTGATGAEIEAVLSQMETEGVILRRPTTDAADGRRSNSVVPALHDAIDVCTPDLIARLAGVA